MKPFYKLRDVIRALDDAPESYSLDRKAAGRRIFVILACCCFCLLLIHYAKYFRSFQALLFTLAEMQSLPKTYFVDKLESTGFLRLFSYCWWTSWHVIGYVVIPACVIRFVLKVPVLDMGWRWGDTHRHWRGYAALLAVVLVLVIAVSQGSDFVAHYPFYKLAHRSIFDFLAWEVLYLLQFLCLEFFFRGFLVNGLRPALGVNAVWVMCVPYLMIHFPKLWLEATGAIFFGFFLGLLAMRSRSIWGGFFVHAGVAVGMDFASLFVQGKIPVNFWP